MKAHALHALNVLGSPIHETVFSTPSKEILNNSKQSVRHSLIPRVHRSSQKFTEVHRSSQNLIQISFLSQSLVQEVGILLGCLAILDVPLPVQHPSWDLELQWFADNCHDLVHFIGGEFSSTFVQVNVALLADLPTPKDCPSRSLALPPFQ